MNEFCQMCLAETRDDMENAINHLEREFQKLRAGKASPQLLEGVKADYYGTLTPIEQMANISSPDPKQLIVQPWDRTALGPLEKAILAANLGFNPQSDGIVLRIFVPPLTEERRKDLVKKARNEAEQAKVAIRNIRKNANTQAKKLEKDGVPEDDIKKLENDIQGMTNRYVTRVDEVLAAKEKDVMTI
ncbi:MAG TPA: ribosome recycling factor [Bacteroidales bacterium]|nr:ribosome recycling factor [Lentimicrobiaceae bacterium]HOH99488.1 ribosome recycling factor [Bacteroidales bacterium]